MQIIYKIIQQIKKFEPDVIHLQQGHLWFNFALPLLRRYPLALTIHDPKPHLGDKGGKKTPQVVMNYGFLSRYAGDCSWPISETDGDSRVSHAKTSIIHVMPMIVSVMKLRKVTYRSPKMGGSGRSSNRAIYFSTS